MASDVIIKNGDSKEVTYPDVSGVELNTPGGGTATFLHEDDIPKELPEVTEEDDGKFLGVVDGEWQATSAPGGGDVLPPIMSGDNGKVLGVRDNKWEVCNVPITWSRLEGIPFGKLKTVFKERQVTMSRASEESDLYEYHTGEDVSDLVEGESYKVKWGEEEYVCEAMDIQTVFDAIGFNVMNADGLLYIGNVSLWLDRAPNTGEPFFYLSEFYIDKAALITRTDVGNITVSITPVNSFKKIPEKYLPESSGGGAGLPEVTEADNGKVLGVVGGKWGVTVPIGGTTIETEKTVSYDFAVQGVPSVSVPFQIMDVTLYKVSIETPSIEELHGAKFVSNYVPGVYAGANVEIDTSMAMISTPDLFISQDCPDGNNGNYSFAVVYKAGEITFELMGTQLTVNSPSAGIYLLFTYGRTPPTNWQFSLTYKTKAVASGGASSPPEFDLAAMGLPNIPMDGTMVQVDCDTTELSTALDKGIVKLSFNVDMGGTSVPVSAVLGAVKISTYTCAVIGVFEGVPMVLQVEVYIGKIKGSVTLLATANQ